MKSILILFLISQIISIQIKTNTNSLTTVERYKVLFMLKLPALKYMNDNLLNTFSYKNVILGNDGILFYMNENEDFVIIYLI
jgi:hypothetical protein